MSVYAFNIIRLALEIGHESHYKLSQEPKKNPMNSCEDMKFFMEIWKSPVSTHNSSISTSNFHLTFDVLFPP